MLNRRGYWLEEEGYPAVYYLPRDDANMSLPHAMTYDQIANWAFVDWMLNFREETIKSTIKIRQAGFAVCIDTPELWAAAQQTSRSAHRPLIAIRNPYREHL